MFATVAPPSKRLLVFARLPERGRVKTRLAETIGPDRALALYRAMLHDVVNSIGAGDESLEIEYLWAPSPHANAELLAEAFGDRTTAMQTGATLGERLAMAFSERFFFHKTDRIIAIGSDDPSIPRSLIDHAFELLESCEYVLGPAGDGGYYLVGCRAATFDTSIFTDIDWGTSAVLGQTIERITALGASFCRLPQRYDIDTAEDLARYAAEGHPGLLGDLLRENAR